MAVAGVLGAKSLGVRGSRYRTRILALLSAVLVAGFGFFAVPAQAHAQGNDPRNWDMPADVTRSSHTLQWRNGSGDTGTGGVGPGYTFYYQFTLKNNGTEPVTVYGFNSNFVFQMHPTLQGDYPLDHCMQFIETVDDPVRQVYPQTIAPGQSVMFSDNATYHYLYGPVSNECQRASFFFGPPSFHSVEVAEPVAPEWREASCDVEARVLIPAVEGVRYLINGQDAEPGEHSVVSPESVTVAAVAVDGFELADGLDDTWAHDFVAPECTVPPGGGGPTDPSGAHPDGLKLAATGFANHSSLWFPGILLVGLGAGLLSARLRRAI